MKFRNSRQSGRKEQELVMTSMIDIVFLLLVFFVMTFQVLAPEGDFSITMPAKAQAEGIGFGGDLPPFRVRLAARPDGRLARIFLGRRELAGFDELNMRIRQIVGDQPDAEMRRATEVELDCDEHLNYEHVIDAITAVSGHISPDGRRVVRLIDRIRLGG